MGKNRDILDEPLDHEEKKKAKKTDQQKASRHSGIGWFSFIICVLLALLSDSIDLSNTIFMIGFGFSLFHIIASTYYKIRGPFNE